MKEVDVDVRKTGSFPCALLPRGVVSAWDHNTGVKVDQFRLAIHIGVLLMSHVYEIVEN